VSVWLRLCRIALLVVSLRLTMFKHDFKRYKRRLPPPDLSEVIDFSQDLCSNIVSEIRWLFIFIQCVKFAN
jgi:hypothetical protein